MCAPTLVVCNQTMCWGGCVGRLGIASSARHRWNAQTRRQAGEGLAEGGMRSCHVYTSLKVSHRRVKTLGKRIGASTKVSLACGSHQSFFCVVTRRFKWPARRRRMDNSNAIINSLVVLASPLLKGYAEGCVHAQGRVILTSPGSQRRKLRTAQQHDIYAKLLKMHRAAWLRPCL